MIIKTIIKIILQENKYRQITGDVLTLGPQTLPLTVSEVDQIIEDNNINIKTGTSNKFPVPNNEDQATAEYFFKKLGANKVDAIDVTLEAGANIEHNLNEVINEDKIKKYDFIFDGGTFDHLINLENAFKNLSNLLKPRGRVIMWNATSNYIGAAYIMFGPDLFYDYFVSNRFLDCKIYLFREMYNFPNSLRDCYYLKTGVSKKLNNKSKQTVLAIAEKGDDSTSSILPVERAYRPSFMNKQYLENEIIIKQSSRPILEGKVSFISKVLDKLNILYYLYFEFIKARKKTKNLIKIYRKINSKKKKIIDYTYIGKI